LVDRKSYNLITRLSWGENLATPESQSCFAGFTDFIHPLNPMYTLSLSHIITYLSLSTTPKGKENVTQHVITLLFIFHG
jgi:hypothetical protein